MSSHEDEFPMERHEPGGCAPPVFTERRPEVPDGLPFPFGIDKGRLVECLAELSKAIADKRTLPQRASYSVESAIDDFELVTISVTYARHIGDQP